jgi:D-alanyl-D-alanine carboxypeptidase
MSVGKKVGAVVVAVSAAATTACAQAQAAQGGPHDETQAVVDGFVAAGAPGAMVFGRDGRRSWSVDAGTAELGTDRPIRPHDRVRVASNTKMYVSAVVLQLVAEGRLGLDDSVEQHLPGLIQGNGYDGDAITVRQLLQHTSGLADYVQDVLDPGSNHPWEPADLVHIGLSHPPVFAPGTGWGYSNTGYIVLGMIVEAVTGDDVGAEITDRIIRPLGLRETSYPETGDREIPGPHAHGYFTFPGQSEEVDVTELEPSIPGAAASMISTGPDMVQFTRALLDGRVVPPDLLAQMRTTVPAQGGGYGLGIKEIPLPCGGEAWGHSGNMPGFDSFTAVTEDGRSAFVVVNGHLDDGSAADVRKAVQTALC